MLRVARCGQNGHRAKGMGYRRQRSDDRRQMTDGREQKVACYGLWVTRCLILDTPCRPLFIVGLPEFHRNLNYTFTR